MFINVSPGQATEVTLYFRKTKNDQLAFGDSKTLQATGQEYLCPVQAEMEAMRKVWTMRFQEGHAESLKPLFRWSSGRVIRRVEIQHLLQLAATGVGLPPERFMIHCLRIGGASTSDIELVKRMGRWSSSAVQRYLFDGGTASASSQRMVQGGGKGREEKVMRATKVCSAAKRSRAQHGTLKSTYNCIYSTRTFETKTRPKSCTCIGWK